MIDYDKRSNKSKYIIIAFHLAPILTNLRYAEYTLRSKHDMEPDFRG